MLLLGDSAKVLKDFNDKCIDLTITSPPYDNMKLYGGNSQFDFKTISQELYRVTKPRGIVIWIRGDQTSNFSESGTSFKQALYFKDLGFNLLDTMIWFKDGFRHPSSTSRRYPDSFEYMFILSKGKPKTFNPLRDRKNKHSNKFGLISRTKPDGTLEYHKGFFGEYGLRYNIWAIHPTNNIKHPASFPEDLVKDHIISWSNEGDTILDPFSGSGTTYKMALLLNRKPVGIEINPEYIEISKHRMIPIYKQY